jgi:transposase
VIGTALARKAKGLGHRRIAAALGRSPSTVRRWLRRARDPAHLNRLWQRGAQELIRLDAEAFNELASTGNLLHDTLTVLAAAAWWARRRLGIAEPVWTLIGLYTRGRLLAPPG